MTVVTLTVKVTLPDDLKHLAAETIDLTGAPLADRVLVAVLRFWHEQLADGGGA